MLKETKLALRVTASAYDSELASLIQAGAKDLQLAGVIIKGRIAFDEVDGVVKDLSTVNDALIVRAIVTYVRCNFGTPVDYDRMKASYDEQKAQLMMATGYTDFGGDCDDKI